MKGEKGHLLDVDKKAETGKILEKGKEIENGCRVGNNRGNVAFIHEVEVEKGGTTNKDFCPDVSLRSPKSVKGNEKRLSKEKGVKLLRESFETSLFYVDHQFSCRRNASFFVDDDNGLVRKTKLPNKEYSSDKGSFECLENNEESSEESGGDESVDSDPNFMDTSSIEAIIRHVSRGKFQSQYK
ncbi:unnamed protein product [Ilex paraguariensis]|uniref:Uncharacterized protein n=1 Tax=Ilex paraguariensis TaxID=185542 RepID=A0ABC8UMK6_9AQUA